jgi:hypothetical protein
MTTLDGRPHSWPVTEYMRTEDWAWEGTFEQAGKMNREEAVERILDQLGKVSPGIDRKKAIRFIGDPFTL